MNTPTMSSGSGSPQAKRTFTAAVRFVAVVVVAALVVLGLAVWWVSGCKTTGDSALAQCGSMQRYTLALGAPLILLLGGVGAFVRTLQVWKARGRWWIWQGAGWFLLAFMLVVSRMSAPAALL